MTKCSLLSRRSNDLPVGRATRRYQRRTAPKTVSCDRSGSASMPGMVHVHVDDGVARVALARPPVNQFDAPFLTEILERVRGLPAGVRAVVVASDVERMFAAGGDLPWMASATIEEQLPFVALCQETYS